MIVNDFRTKFYQLHDIGATIDRACKLFDLTPEEAGLALHYARLTKLMQAPIDPPIIKFPERKPAKTFCDQCERLVCDKESALCGSPFCKAKEAA